jgi:hypothetical protein
MIPQYKSSAENAFPRVALHERNLSESSEGSDGPVAEDLLDVEEMEEMLSIFPDCPIISLAQAIASNPTAAEKFLDFRFFETLAEVIESERALEGLYLLGQLSRMDGPTGAMVDSAFSDIPARLIHHPRDDIYQAVLDIVDATISRAGIDDDPSQLLGSAIHAHYELMAEGDFESREKSLIFFSNLLVKTGRGTFGDMIPDGALGDLVEFCVQMDVLCHERFVGFLISLVEIGLSRGLDWRDHLMEYLEGIDRTECTTLVACAIEMVLMAINSSNSFERCVE